MAVKQKWGLLLVVAVLFLTVSNALAIENWPMLNHDPQMTGRTGTFVTGTVTKKWEKQFSTSASYRAQPVVVNEVVYFVTVDGVLRAIDVRTGTVKWSISTGGVVLGSPAVSAGRVVIGVSLGDHGEVRAYDLQGQQKWVVTTTDPVSASPIIYRGLVVVGAHDGYVYAIDLEDGMQIWKSPVEGRVLGAAAADKGLIVVAGDNLKGYAFDLTGVRKWMTDLPGETIRDTQPLIAADTVLFTTTSRANEYQALEDQPNYGENPLDTGNPNFNPPESVLTTNEPIYTQNPPARSTKAVNLQTGAEKFKVALSTPYWGALNPVMLTPNEALKHAYYSSFSINMATGAIKWLGGSNTLFRGDEYAYSSVGGGKREYGAVADDLGVYDFTQMRMTTLVGAFWSHYVPDWIHPPDATNNKMYVAGPGDGNSGYATTPVIYDNLIIWQNNGSWLMAHQGTGGHEAPDSQAPSVPGGLTKSTGTSDSISLSWSAATDNVGVYGYRVYRDGVVIAETDETNFIDRNLASNTTYQFSVTAYDRLNNESNKSVVLSAKTGQGSSPTQTPTITPTTTPMVCAGDINLDQSVNLTDYSILVANFLKSPLSDPNSDLNGDTRCDLKDYSILVNHFLKPCSAN